MKYPANEINCKNEPSASRARLDDGTLAQPVLGGTFNTRSAPLRGTLDVPGRPPGEGLPAHTRHRPYYSEGKRVDSVRLYLDQIDKIPLLTAEQEVELAKKIEAGLYALHLLHNPNSQKGTLIDELPNIVQEGIEAKEQMILANLRLVVNIAKNYSRNGIPLQDMIQEGTLGLIRAVEKFDYKKGFKFSTYATPWIKKMLQVGASENDQLIRLSYRTHDEAGRIERIHQFLEQRLGREPSAEQIAYHAGVDAQRVQYLQERSRRTVSLDTPLSDDEDGGTVFGEIIVDDCEEPVDDQCFKKILLKSLSAALNGLSEIEQTTVQMEFGMYDGIPKRYEKIARMTGWAIKDVRLAGETAIKKLRQDSSRFQIFSE